MYAGVHGKSNQGIRAAMQKMRTEYEVFTQGPGAKKFQDTVSGGL